ncbi:MAG TPA: TIR domain-containing protein [Candidatus Angelobacter sp.]|jgi:ATP-dependent Clp protease ATP-binding subunit ClpC
MFERFTEKLRRVIFFARYEASQFGSPSVEPEHLLLGLLREDKSLTNRFLRSHASVESIRKQIEGHTTIREKVSTSVDLPFGNASKRILAYTAEEAERLSQRHIGTEHLLLGLLREEKSLAAEILHERGLRLSAIREELARSVRQPVQRAARKSDVLGAFAKDLTQMAINNELDRVIARDQEIGEVIEVLCSRNIKNPILIGDRGAGKTAVVEGLAQRIADGEVPHFLADKRILAFDVQLLVGGPGDQKPEAPLNAVIKELIDIPEIIMFIDEFQSLIGAHSIPVSRDAAKILRPALLSGEIQCIGACSPGDYQRSIQVAPWLGRCCRTVNVLPLDEVNTIKLLYGRKEQYEKFHAVSYTDEALEDAVYYSRQYFPDDSLVTKAAEILDIAGSRVKLRQTMLPEEITEVQKRIKLIVHRMENAIANHDFTQARSLSDEERVEREKLRSLREKYHMDESSIGVVARKDIEEVVHRWTGISIDTMRQQLAAGGSTAVPETPMPAGTATQKHSTLKVFLCHSSKDKPAVRALYETLKQKQIDPWLDEKNILPGKSWQREIAKAVRSSDAVIVCLSTHSMKAGYLHKEIKTVLDVADRQPEDTIYVIPLKLEECDVPEQLQDWQWVNFFEPNGLERLMAALHERAQSLGVRLE